jgi:tetratricopeptide (TPR) repeat protein
MWRIDRVRSLRLAGLLAVVATAPLSAQLAITQPTERLLLLPLTVAVGADSAASVRTVDAVRERLEKLARYKVIVIPKQKICEALTASGFPCDGLIGEQQARQLARFLDADAFSVGVLERDGAGLAARVRVVDVGGSGFGYAFTAREGAASSSEGLAEAIAQRLNSIVRAGERARECEQQRQRGQLGRALESARKALENEPDLPAAHLCTATVYEAQRATPDSVIAAARRALRGDSANTRALESIARQYQIKGDTVEALHYFERVVAADPGNKAIGLGLAAQYQLRRDFDGAERVLRRLAERFPGDEQISERLYQVCIEGGKWACVLDILRTRTQRDTALLGDTATLKIAIGAAQSLPDTQALLRYSAEAVRRFPQDLAFIGVRGAAFELAGAVDSAVAWYTRAYRADSTAPNALRVAKAIIDAAMWDTTGAGADSTVLVRRRAMLGERLETARPFVKHGLTSPDTAVRLNTAVSMLTAGSKLAQAAAFDRAYPWLEEVLTVVAPRSPADTTGAPFQIRMNASFWYAVASTLTLREALQEVIDKKSCALAAKVHQRIEKTRRAADLGRRVHEPTMRQMLGYLDQYQKPMRQVKQGYDCTNF